MGVVDDISIPPVLDPVVHAENFHLPVRCGADDPVQTGVDDHLLADEAGERIYRLEFAGSTAVNVHVSTQEADSGTGRVNDRVLLSVDAPAEFIPLAVRNVQLVPEAGAVLEAVLGFPRRSHISCGNDLVVADDDRSYGAAETGAAPGDFFGNAQIILIL